MKSLGFVLAWLAAVAVVVMMVFDGLVAPLTGVLSLAALVLALFWWFLEAPARREQRRRDRQATEWLGRVPQPGDRKRWTPEELARGADIDAILAEDAAHNRLGL